MAQQTDALCDEVLCMSLTELPTPCLRTVLLALWSDPRDLAAASCCCQALAELCADQQLWRAVPSTRRYGVPELPGTAPALCEASSKGLAKLCSVFNHYLLVSCILYAYCCILHGCCAGQWKVEQLAMQPPETIMDPNHAQKTRHAHFVCHPCRCLLPCAA
jgi:hypothetical protein